MIKSLFLICISLFAFFCFLLLSLRQNNIFSVCKEQATAVESRTVRIHQFPEENKCAVIYSVEGQDQMISQGPMVFFL